MSSKIGKGEWIGLYVFAGIVDVTQWVIDFVGALLSGVAIGEILLALSEMTDPIVGMGLAGYFQIRGVSLITHPSRLISLIGVTGLEAVTGGIAPAWILDVWYIHNTVKKEDAEIKAKKEQEESSQNNTRRFKNNDGVRDDTQEDGSEDEMDKLPPLNQEGIRKPNR